MDEMERLVSSSTRCPAVLLCWSCCSFPHCRPIRNLLISKMMLLGWVERLWPEHWTRHTPAPLCCCPPWMKHVQIPVIHAYTDTHAHHVYTTCIHRYWTHTQRYIQDDTYTESQILGYNVINILITLTQWVCLALLQVFLLLFNMLLTYWTCSCKFNCLCNPSGCVLILTVVLYNDVFGELQKAYEIVNGCKRTLYLKINTNKSKMRYVSWYSLCVFMSD